MPSIKEVGRVMVPVSDQDRAIEFYVEKLGFEKRADTPYGDGDRWVEVAPPGSAAALALVKPREGDSAGGDSRVALSTDDVDSVHASLKDRGVDVDDVMRMGDPVPPMFFFRDQDGNSMLIVEAG
jgi:catechol 2,3-dioxygenase-like lactoylglutathione lyase family enzyme